MFQDDLKDPKQPVKEKPPKKTTPVSYEINGANRKCFISKRNREMK